MQLPADAVPRFDVGTKQVTGEGFRKLAVEALKSKRKRELQNILNGLIQGAYSELLKNREGVDLLVKLLVETRTLAESDSEIRRARKFAMRNALMFIEQLQRDAREKARSFIVASATDPDDDIAKYGAALLNVDNK